MPKNYNTAMHKINYLCKLNTDIDIDKQYIK